MKFLNRVFQTKELKAVLGVLAEADQKFSCRAFDIVKKRVEDDFLTNAEHLPQILSQNPSARAVTYRCIVDFTQDCLLSGNFHLFGTLNPLTGGEDLLRIALASIDELEQMGAYTPEAAERSRQALRHNVDSVAG
jgi:hypothetical protein